MNLTIIVPVYNESKRIDHLIAELKKFLSTSHLLKVDFLIVDDGSTDDTKEQAIKLIDNHDNILITGYPKNSGKGAAVFFGMQAATSDYIGFMDADVATPMGHIDSVMKIIKQESPGFIIGNRRATSTVYESFIRTIASNFFNIIAHLPLRNRYPDTQAGFKFYHGNFVKELVRLSTIKNFSFDIEHILIAEVVGIKVHSYPINDWFNGDNSKVSLVKDGIKMFKSCFKLFMARALYKDSFQVNKSLENKSESSDSQAA
jgi:dolichyl-phosphate beta-glucosyltransferase